MPLISDDPKIKLSLTRKTAGGPVPVPGSQPGRGRKVADLRGCKVEEIPAGKSRLGAALEEGSASVYRKHKRFSGKKGMKLKTKQDRWEKRIDQHEKCLKVVGPGKVGGKRMPDPVFPAISSFHFASPFFGDSSRSPPAPSSSLRQ